METLKCDGVLQQDPDYFMPIDNNLNNQDLFKENAQTTTDKISAIIETEFSKEINNKKAEIFKIYKNLNKACKMLHYLRFAIVSDYYNQENAFNDDVKTIKQPRLHCTVNAPAKPISLSDFGYTNKCLEESNVSNGQVKADQNIIESKTNNLPYVNKEANTDSLSLFSTNTKNKKRLIVGNISKWIHPDLRDSEATHKWTVYVRDSQKSDLGQIISKVRFFLHPSYKPNDVVELLSPPFILARFGWGEFPVRVQLHFRNSFDKPVDIIHPLKLDKTFTGLQTKGSETVVDVWISNKDISILSKEDENNSISVTQNKLKEIKTEKSKPLKPTTICHFIHDHDYLRTYTSSCGYYINDIQEIENEGKNTLQSTTNNKVSCQTDSDENLVDNCKITPKNDKDQVVTIKKLNIPMVSTLKTNVNQSHQNLLTNTKDFLNKSDIDKKKSIISKYDILLRNDQSYKDLINSIKKKNPSTLLNMLKYVARRVPLITQRSIDHNYKVMHPYATENNQIFKNYSEGKRRSLERYQAIYMLKIMINTKCYMGSCNIKELMTWAKRYCYTPVSNYKDIKSICLKSQSVDGTENNMNYEHTSTTLKPLNKWLLKCQKAKPKRQNFNIVNDDEVDVLSIPSGTSSSNIESHKLWLTNSNPVIILEYPEKEGDLSEYVSKTAQKIGIKLVNEEIIPEVSHSTSTMLISTAIECLMDELIRVAFSCAVDRCKTQENTVSIELDDVRMALLKREEFDIFTNVGLGSEG